MYRTPSRRPPDPGRPARPPAQSTVVCRAQCTAACPALCARACLALCAMACLALLATGCARRAVKDDSAETAAARSDPAAVEASKVDRAVVQASEVDRAVVQAARDDPAVAKAAIDDQSEADLAGRSDAGEGPRLLCYNGRWYVTGLALETARLMDRDRLLVVERPIPGTRASEPVAVLRSIRNAREGDTVAVAVHCAARGARLEPGLAVRPLYQGKSLEVGQCLGTILEDRGGEDGGDGARTDDGGSENGRRVRIDLGRDDGVRPGDLYEIVGLPAVDMGRPMPVLHGSQDNGRCVVSLLEADIAPLHAWCLVGALPKGVPHLEGRLVLFLPRESSGATGALGCSEEH